MTSPRNPNHVKRGHEGRDESYRDFRDLEARNEALGRAPEEPRNVHKAGGGVVGDSQGGAHTGRRSSHVESVSNREPKARGQDKPE